MSGAEIIDKAFALTGGADKPEGIVENFFFSIGLMTGPNAVYYRFIFGSLVTSMFLWAIRPSPLFDSKGKARGWAAAGVQDGVILPWWALAAAAGLACSLFI